MNDAPAPKKKFNILKQLDEEDLIALYKFFDAPKVDYPALNAMIEKRFEHLPVLLNICRVFASTMERFEAGERLKLEAQQIVAKNVLSLIINSGRVDAAKAFLAACVEKLGRETMPIIQTMYEEIDSDVKKLSMLDRTWLDYQVFDRGHPTTIILMCGNSHRFGVEVNIVSLWLDALPVNLIVMRDFKLTLYLGGLRTLGNLDQALARVRTDLAAMGSKRLVVMGNSGGAYGALLFGHHLGADQVLCFAGPTSLDGEHVEAAERPVYQRIERLAERGSLTVPDMRAYYESNGIPVRYFYGLHYPFDVAQSKGLAGLPNVKLEGLDGFDKHVVIGEMARRKILTKVFAEAAGV